MINVTVKVPVYEINQKEVNINKTENLEVASHWSMGDRIVIRMGDRNITVMAKDLKCAVDRCQLPPH